MKVRKGSQSVTGCNAIIAEPPQSLDLSLSSDLQASCGVYQTFWDEHSSVTKTTSLLLLSSIHSSPHGN